MEKIELKDKNEKIERKEKIEKIEQKEKLEKIERKEKIEKLEHKEKNEIIEHKKDFDHKLSDGHPVINPGLTGGMSDPTSGLAERVQQLEMTVNSLTSFIDSSLRPDLSQGALSNE